jgi:hypothetical protein
LVLNESDQVHFNLILHAPFFNSKIWKKYNPICGSFFRQLPSLLLLLGLSIPANTIFSSPLHLWVSLSHRLFGGLGFGRNKIGYGEDQLFPNLLPIFLPSRRQYPLPPVGAAHPSFNSPFPSIFFPNPRQCRKCAAAGPVICFYFERLRRSPPTDAPSFLLFPSHFPPVFVHPFSFENSKFQQNNDPGPPSTKFTNNFPFLPHPIPTFVGSNSLR